MSIFKDSGIILHIKKLEEKKFLYTILSLKFGKILTQKKINSKEKTLDLGFHINYEIKTNNNINIISNIKIINEFNTIGKNFEEINYYLNLLKIVLYNSPNGIENQEIFEIINHINKYSGKDFLEKTILASLKSLNIFGILDINHKDNTISKILIFINKNNFNKIIKLSGINEEIKKELEKIL